MSKYGTNFVETEAILAAQEKDYEEVERILNDMLPGELQQLYTAADDLALRARQHWIATSKKANTDGSVMY